MKKILVVEDDQTLRKVLNDKLEHDGYEVVSAENGQVGLEKALSDNPDCILLDVIMPVKDGISMLRDLRRSKSASEIPVILLTNLDDSQTALDALENGVTDYLVKSDWTLEDVLLKIEAVTSDK